MPWPQWHLTSPVCVAGLGESSRAPSSNATRPLPWPQWHITSPVCVADLRESSHGPSSNATRPLPWPQWILTFLRRVWQNVRRAGSSALHTPPSPAAPWPQWIRTFLARQGGGLYITASTGWRRSGTAVTLNNCDIHDNSAGWVSTRQKNSSTRHQMKCARRSMAPMDFLTLLPSGSG